MLKLRKGAIQARITGDLRDHELLPLSIIWVVKWRKLATGYQHFWMAYRSQLQGSSTPKIPQVSHCWELHQAQIVYQYGRWNGKHLCDESMYFQRDNADFHLFHLPIPKIVASLVESRFLIKFSNILGWKAYICSRKTWVPHSLWKKEVCRNKSGLLCIKNNGYCLKKRIRLICCVCSVRGAKPTWAVCKV